jgi:hypothetical protein
VVVAGAVVVGAGALVVVDPARSVSEVEVVDVDADLDVVTAARSGDDEHDPIAKTASAARATAAARAGLTA